MAYALLIQNILTLTVYAALQHKPRKGVRSMVLFGFIFFVSVAALLGVRAMDIECEYERKPRAYKGGRIEQRSGFPAQPIGLRQV
jgi:hypothetical protein